jgi:hypothetical protein
VETITLSRPLPRNNAQANRLANLPIRGSDVKIVSLARMAYFAAVAAPEINLAKERANWRAQFLPMPSVWSFDAVGLRGFDGGIASTGVPGR